MTLINQETKKISKNLTLHLKELEKEEKTNAKVNKMKEITKITVEINEKD